jgi:hypothetical protein
MEWTLQRAQAWSQTGHAHATPCRPNGPGSSIFACAGSRDGQARAVYVSLTPRAAAAAAARLSSSARLRAASLVSSTSTCSRAAIG